MFLQEQHVIPHIAIPASLCIPVTNNISVFDLPFTAAPIRVHLTNHRNDVVLPTNNSEKRSKFDLFRVSCMSETCASNAGRRTGAQFPASGCNYPRSRVNFENGSVRMRSHVFADFVTLQPFREKATLRRRGNESFHARLDLTSDLLFDPNFHLAAQLLSYAASQIISNFAFVQ